MTKLEAQQLKALKVELASALKELKGLEPAIAKLKESMAGEISELKAALSTARCENTVLKECSRASGAEAARMQARIVRLVQSLLDIDKKVRAPDEEDAPMALVEFEVPRRVDELLKRTKEDKA